MHIDHTIQTTTSIHIYRVREDNVGCRILVKRVDTSTNDKETTESFQLHVGDAEMRSTRNENAVYAAHPPRVLSRNELVALRNAIDEALL